MQPPRRRRRAIPSPPTPKTPPAAANTTPSPGNRHQPAPDAFQALRSRERRRRPADQLKGRSWPLRARLERKRHQPRIAIVKRLLDDPPAGSRNRAPCYGEAVAKPNAASRTPAAGTGSVSIPRLFIDQHLRDVHGAALNVYLALCGQQARAGRRKNFRYTIPEIGQAAGLKKRIISKAIESLVERRLIERQRRPGPVGNLYRIIWGRPAATNGEPIPASGETDVPRWNPTEPEQAAVVATRPAGEQEDGGAGRGENKKQEAQITKDTTHPAPRQAEAHPPTLSEPESSSLPQESILTTMPPTEPLEPAGGEQKAIPSPSTPAKTPPAAANTAQPHPMYPRQIEIT